MLLKLLTTVLVIHLAYCLKQQQQQELDDSHVHFESVDRTIDLSSQIAKISNKIVVKNSGNTAVTSILFSTEDENVGPAYVSAQVSVSKQPLRITELPPTTKSNTPPHRNKTTWRVYFDHHRLLSGETVTIEWHEQWTDVIRPFPARIGQKDKQLVRYHGNAYLYTGYKVGKLTTSVRLQTRNVESYTKRQQKQTTYVGDGTISYGPYYQIEPYSVNPISVHYENSSPFLVIKNLERVIEVSHWGNIAVEETVELLHTGAKLKGSFSRYDYQRESGSGQPSIKSFKMMLPAAAIGTYYRDDIGNISTSYMRILKDAVELEIRPRFPLFGGWQTRHIIGYSVPSYEYLYNSGAQYLFKMRLIDHVFDDMVVEKLTTRIILPEGVHGIELQTPYPVVRKLPDQLHYTYLDTRGRLVLHLSKTNLIENHIQDFVLKYQFASVLMLQEPLLLVIALYSLFLCVIIYVRLDFSIAKDSASECKMRAAGLCERVQLHQDKRSYFYQLYDAQLTRLKTSKDLNGFSAAMKSLNAEYKCETSAIAELGGRLRVNAAAAGGDVWEKVQEMQKLDKQLRELYGHHQALYVEKLIPGKIGRSAFVDAENSFYKKRNDLLDNIHNLYKSLE